MYMLNQCTEERQLMKKELFYKWLLETEKSKGTVDSYSSAIEGILEN